MTKLESRDRKKGHKAESRHFRGEEDPSGKLIWYPPIRIQPAGLF